MQTPADNSRAPAADVSTAASPPSSYNRSVPAVAQAARILFCLARPGHSRLTLTGICREVGIHKSKGYSILNTLLDFGLVARDPSTKSYSLGAGALVLSRSLLDSMDLRQAVAPFLRRLVHETGSTALLGLRLAGGVVVAAKEEAGAGIGVSIRVGHRYPLTWGAHGKAMVAFLPVAERTAALEEATLYFWGESGGSAELRARLPQELAAVRNLGYAKDLGAVQPGVQAVSAPVFGSRGEPTACLIVVGTFATDRADPFGALVAATAAEVSALYGPILEAFRRDG